MRVTAREYIRHNRALIIGVSAYASSGLVPLPSPKHDAEVLAAALIDMQADTPLSDRIRCLTDPTATQIIDSFVAAVASAELNDNLIIYFAGHGVSQGNDFYLCATDTDIHNLPGTAISGARLEQILRDCPARGILMILDCCLGASFAELSPDFFRRLGTSEFRILLSATRAAERSWERRDGSGTLFTHHLLQAIQGREPVGAAPGFIYFSDLLHHIQNAVAEDLESAGLPHQEPVFTGSYARDPLLFVDPRRVRGDVTVQTLRYSRAYIRRLITRLTAAAVTLLVISTGFYYAILEHSEYVMASPEGLTVFQGVPGFNALGFPRRLWTFSISAEMAADSSSLRRNKAVRARLGESVLPNLLPNLNPEMQALVLHWQGRDSEARMILKPYLKRNLSRPGGMMGAASQLFADVATKEDTSLLRLLAQDAHRDIKVGGLRGLLRVDTPLGARTAIQQQLPLDNALHQQVLSGITDADPASLTVYLAALLRWPHYGGTHAWVFDSALRFGCHLSDDDLYAANANVYSLSEDIGMYAALKNLDRQLAPRLLHALHTWPPGPGNWADKAHTLHSLSVMPVTPCQPFLWDYLRDPDSFVKQATARILLERCPNAASKMRAAPDAISNNYVVAELAQHGQIDFRVVLRHLETANARFTTASIMESTELLDGLAHLKATEAIPWLLNRLRREGLNPQDSELAKQILIALRRLRAPSDAAPAYFSSQWLGLQREAYAWYAQQHPEDVIQSLLERLNDEQADYVEELLASLPLTAPQLEMLRKRLSGSSTERTRAAGILAMKESVASVLTLLSNPDPQIRSAAADYVPANPAFDTIVRQHNTNNRFPDSTTVYLKEQNALKQQISTELDQMPAWAQAWRLRVFETTHSLSPGLQIRIQLLKTQ